jgi:hypothetical protein
VFVGLEQFVDDVLADEFELGVEGDFPMELFSHFLKVVFNQFWVLYQVVGFFVGLLHGVQLSF